MFHAYSRKQGFSTGALFLLDADYVFVHCVEKTTIWKTDVVNKTDIRKIGLKLHQTTHIISVLAKLEIRPYKLDLTQSFTENFNVNYHQSVCGYVHEKKIYIYF